MMKRIFNSFSAKFYEHFKTLEDILKQLRNEKYTQIYLSA